MVAIMVIKRPCNQNIFTKRPCTIITFVLHQVQSNILNYWCCTAEKELGIENLITKVVITMVTKRPYIPVGDLRQASDSQTFRGARKVRGRRTSLKGWHGASVRVCERSKFAYFFCCAGTNA